MPEPAEPTTHLGMPAWGFAFPGPLRDELTALALDGTKTATASLGVDFVVEGSRCRREPAIARSSSTRPAIRSPSSRSRSRAVDDRVGQRRVRPSRGRGVRRRRRLASRARAVLERLHRGPAGRAAGSRVRADRFDGRRLRVVPASSNGWTRAVLMATRRHAGATALTTVGQHAGMERSIAISRPTVGSERLYSSIVSTAPGDKTRIHHHGDCETSIYIVSGGARYTWGPTGLEHEMSRRGRRLHLHPGRRDPRRGERQRRASRWSSS